jgi:hypothetical protein
MEIEDDEEYDEETDAETDMEIEHEENSIYLVRINKTHCQYINNTSNMYNNFVV